VTKVVFVWAEWGQSMEVKIKKAGELSAEEVPSFELQLWDLYIQHPLEPLS